MQTASFTAFKSDIGDIALPQRFPYVFTYEPHSLCRVAAEELQQTIQSHPEWNDWFGLGQGSIGVGKMFGVLVVQAADGSLGYLAGFSGAIDGRNAIPGFVPPVYDLLNPQGFFKLGERQLNELNRAIGKLENSDELRSAKERLGACQQELEFVQTQWKARLKAGKKARKKQRMEAAAMLDGAALEERLEKLNRDSQLEKLASKKAIAEHKQQLEQLQKQLAGLLAPLEAMKQQRKEQSARLQGEIFDQFRLLNYRQELKTVSAIFREQGEELPPAGAGDCAGPKLLQYAFQQQLKPIALAEFWWGASPKSAVRKHKQFYPPCRSKCAPLMKQMLKGLDMEPDPLTSQLNQPRELEILFEDAWIMVVNKPGQFLSVPGKQITDSVLQRVRQMRPDAQGPLLVHRLDMSTSGILLVAKDPVTHKALQSQFMKRTTRKRYVAVLNGLLEQEQGVIDLPLRVDLDNRPQQLVCFEHGKSARTRWEVIARQNGKTRVYFYPITGRTHQLRVHAAHIDGLNTPIVGDELYGTAADRLYLHAESIEIIHPQTGQRMKFTAPVPF
ncbi:tRNA pseudouridine32 synthase / 23S rRNA pseudouridine746 synthase [Mangrovibacterium marinum]|uniref:tRNA pseudouridine32 synthase / 23S rRNA pseudouridine746 synthase n=1 Tax=Mangrovibacterium marinum TaxID=1639118 RepID=A0A2T5C571_9BACT|nr:RluA family pseudouridine synthase [Mangrovibacterium marinum]PTN10029.1 tRNA pseudouridine32 synthase / 23S rRNA pseudouridine746 synthase [Mangrovibacterium marinum]